MDIHVRERSVSITRIQFVQVPFGSGRILFFAATEPIAIFRLRALHRHPDRLFIDHIDAREPIQTNLGEGRDLRGRRSRSFGLEPALHAGDLLIDDPLADHPDHEAAGKAERHRDQRAAKHGVAWVLRGKADHDGDAERGERGARADGLGDRDLGLLLLHRRNHRGWTEQRDECAVLRGEDHREDGIRSKSSRSARGQHARKARKEALPLIGSIGLGAFAGKDTGKLAHGLRGRSVW